MTAEMPSWERRWWRLPLVAVSAVARPDHDQFWTDGGDDHIHSAGRCEGPYGPDGNGDICVERKSARRFIAAGWLIGSFAAPASACSATSLSAWWAPSLANWLLSEIGTHFGIEIIGTIISATIGAVLLLIILRLFRDGGGRLEPTLVARHDTITQNNNR
jgi:Transglycosylase associated protein